MLQDQELFLKLNPHVSPPRNYPSNINITTIQPGILRYSISRLSGIEEDARSSLKAAKARQFREYNIPSGVEDMKEWWEQLNFGGVHQEETAVSVPYNAQLFKHPDKMVRKLRSLSRSGRVETERLAAEELGKPKYLLGEVEPIPADVIQALAQDAQDSLMVPLADGDLEALAAVADTLPSEEGSMSGLDEVDPSTVELTPMTSLEEDSVTIDPSRTDTAEAEARYNARSPLSDVLSKP